uniref:F-box/kelch-repeat protein At3g06240 family n=1 Tax=Cajanus cajan TaxID=3821 RepID=A0A151UDU3_CAJCA
MFFSCFLTEILPVDASKPLLAVDASCILPCAMTYSNAYMKIVGTCRGIILIWVLTYFLIWNPSTGFTRSFYPYPPTIMKICGDYFGLNYYGFGYDRSKDNYVVVQIYLSKCDSSHRALVYSMNAASWRDFEDDSLLTITYSCISVHQGSIGLYFGDSLHWITFNWETNVDVILVYNLIDSKFYELNIPSEVKLEDYTLCCLRIIRGWLAFCTVMRDENWDYMVDIWEMKEYGVHTSWTKLISMQVSNDFPGYMLSACSSDDSILFVNNETGVLATWNAIDETLQYRNIGHVTQCEHEMIMCEETLLST